MTWLECWCLMNEQGQEGNTGEIITTTAGYMPLEYMVKRYLAGDTSVLDPSMEGDYDDADEDKDDDDDNHFEPTGDPTDIDEAKRRLAEIQKKAKGGKNDK